MGTQFGWAGVSGNQQGGVHRDGQVDGVSDQVNREGGHVDHATFDEKLLNTQYCVGRCACKSPIMKWAKMLKESSKKCH